MRHKNLSVKNNGSSAASENIKFNLAFISVIVLIVSGITLSLLNNLGTIGKVNPTVVRNYNVPGEITDIFAERNYAYLTYNIYDNDNPVTPVETGLQILNISYKEDPQLIIDYKTPMGADSIFVEGNFAYIANSQTGLQIVKLIN